LLDEAAPSFLRLETRELLTSRATLNNRIREAEHQQRPVPDEVNTSYSENTARLFEIFIQREDMLKFSNDFAEIESMLGPAENTPGNISEWNNILLDKRELYVNINDVLASFNPTKKQKLTLNEKKLIVVEEEGEGEEGEQGEVQGSEGEVKEGEGEDVSDEEFLQAGAEKKSYFNVQMSRDHDGHIWTTMIIHEDQTQVVTAGGRVQSFRILLTIGNLRGVGGYGMGKGSSPKQALNNAFRSLS
jgi:hypothetical protein